MEGMEGQGIPAQDIQCKIRSLPLSPSLPPAISIPPDSLLPSEKESCSSSQSPVKSTSTGNSSQSPIKSSSPGKSPPLEKASPIEPSAEGQPDEMTTIVYPADQPNPRIGFMETTVAKNEEELIQALRLITDSIAQQRQIAASSILHHPLYFLFLIIMAEYLWRALYYTQNDLLMVAIIWLAGVAISMKVVKILVSKYLDEAERVGTWSWLFGAQWVQYFGDGRETNQSLFWVLWNRVWVRVPGGDPEAWRERTRLLMNWNWPDSSSSSASSASSSSSGSSGSASTSASSSENETDTDDENAARWDRYRQQQQRQREAEEAFEAHSIPNGWLRDWIFISKFQGKVIAALVMRVLPIGQNTVPVPGSRSQGGTLRNRAVIRAWTVEQSFRGHGLGMEVLGFAVEVAKNYGWEGPVFADDHANSKRLWLGLFNERMNRMEKRARALLAREIRAQGLEVPADETV